MIYRYWQSGSRLLPLVPITIFGSREPLETLALADSGSDENVAGADIAVRLGIALEGGKKVLVKGVGKERLVGKVVDIQLQLGKRKWIAPTVFLPAVGDRIILGQAGFFAFFNVDFRYHQKAMHIRRVS